MGKYTMESSSGMIYTYEYENSGRPCRVLVDKPDVWYRAIYVEPVTSKTFQPVGYPSIRHSVPNPGKTYHQVELLEIEDDWLKYLDPKGLKDMPHVFLVVPDSDLVFDELLPSSSS